MNKAISKFITTPHKRELAILIEKAGKVKIAQEAIKLNGTTIAVDGELGPQTATAIENSRMTPILDQMYHLDNPKTLIKALGNANIPEWIKIAAKEIGVHEIRGAKNNPRVVEYMRATKWGKWVTNDETPWCAGFVGWCMVEAGYIDEIPDYSLGAKSWLNFGVSAHKPVLGAIAVKSRKGGGHVGFVVGEEGDYLYILGGNQSDAVCVKKYPKRVWIDFRIPKDYTPTLKLARYDGISALAGKEA